MRRLGRLFLVAAMLFSLAFSISADDSNTIIVEMDGQRNVGVFNCVFTAAENGAPVLIIGYYPFEDVAYFMPEFIVEQEHGVSRYDIYGIEGKINVVKPVWYSMGDGLLPAETTLIMYVMLPYNFRANRDVTVYFKTRNGVTWHQFLEGRPDSETMEATRWNNGKQL